MPAMTIPRTTGDEREDAASAAGTKARDALERAELVILAGMAAELRKMAAGSLTAQAAQRHARALVSVTLGEAMRQIRPLLGGLPPDAQQRIRSAILQAQQNAATAFRNAAEGMSATLNALFAQAVRAYFGGGPALPLPPGNTATLRASQLAAAQQVMDSLAAKGITGFTDSAGRDWDVAAYVEASLRLATSRAHLDAQVRSFSAAGSDLVLVVGPTGADTCPACRPWSGRLVSLGPVLQESASIIDAAGASHTFEVAGTLEQAIAEGLLHPHCRHSIQPWEDGADLTPSPYGAREAPNLSYTLQQHARALQRDLRISQRRAAAVVTPAARRHARTRLAGAAQRAGRRASR